MNNVSPPAIKGTVNGIAQALLSIFRSMGYLVAALMFAWSQNNGIIYYPLQSVICYFNITTIVFFISLTGNSWPLNYHFTFILLTVMVLCLLPLIFSLSKSVETKKLYSS